MADHTQTTLKRQQQAEQVGKIWLRSARYRHSCASFALLCVLYFTGLDATSLCLTAFLIVEFAIQMHIKDAQRNDGPMSNLAYYRLWTLDFMATIVYSSPTFFLYASGDLTASLIGLLWITGVMLFTASTFYGINHYYWANFGPASVLLIATFFIPFAQNASSGSLLSWAMVFIAAGMFIYNALLMLKQKERTELLLKQAQAEATARLKELEGMSHADQLTGLPNRTNFDNRLQNFFAHSDEIPRHCLVGLIDLNGFKPINDSFGHHAGDAVLIEFGKRLDTYIGEKGIVARLGGDEFAFKIRHIKTEEEATEIAEDICALLSKPVHCGDVQLTVTGSVGLSLSKQLGTDPKKLLIAADQAMFAAKKSVGQFYQIFNPQTTPKPASLQEKIILEKAINAKEIQPFYQAQVDLLTKEVIGFEALARWVTPDNHVHSPGQFIPKLHDLGLMDDFTFSITRQVLEDIQRWADMGAPAVPVSINIDDKTLSTANGVQDLLWLFSEHKEATKQITLEVTEDVVLARAGDFIRSSIDALAETGIRISLDDFGTGFASFRHLQELQLDELKIDTSFVTSIGDDQAANIIIEGFLGIAAGLGIEVMAEGVETEEQRQFLINSGCRNGQGFLFSKPEPFEATTARLTASEQKLSA